MADVRFDNAYKRYRRDVDKGKHGKVRPLKKSEFKRIYDQEGGHVTRTGMAAVKESQKRAGIWDITKSPQAGDRWNQQAIRDARALGLDPNAYDNFADMKTAVARAKKPATDATDATAPDATAAATAAAAPRRPRRPRRPSHK